MPAMARPRSVACTMLVMAAIVVLSGRSGRAEEISTRTTGRARKISPAESGQPVLDPRPIAGAPEDPPGVVADQNLRGATDLASTSAGLSPAAASWIAVFDAFLEPAVREHGGAVWDRDGEIVVAGLSDRQLRDLREAGIAPRVKIPDRGELLYILSHREGFAAPRAAEAEARPLSPTADLYLFPQNRSFELPPVKPFAGFRGVPRDPLPPLEMHPADRARMDGAGGDPRALSRALSVNPLVAQIVNATSQANWFQDVKDLSGENSVVIGGSPYTIATRYSYAMFPPALNARASEYLLDRGAGWGYSGQRESYATAQSGCMQGGNTWQNLIFTLPGQVDFGQRQQVLFVTHYDSLSFTQPESFNYAPGADDAISGGCALIEALRLFKDYGFRNTVKIIFFSGEEQGLCGSIAYTHQHPSTDIWRVVNMDQTAYDGNRDRVMALYNWSAVNSPASVALGDAFIQANSDYGPMIVPANISRFENKMCQTDHCPFWNVGVAAIALLENYPIEYCPCFDTSQTPTCHDTVTQMDDLRYPTQLMFDQDYSWLTEKTAIATVAALAEPLYACPPAAPDPVIAPGNNVLHLSWPAASGVTNYVVERSASCAGPFTAVASATGTSYDDITVSNGGAYAYRIRTCPTQTSACVTASPQAGPSVIYQAGSAVVTDDSGDHDAFADNCELVTVQVNLVNDGNAPLTGVKLAAAGSTHAGVQVATAIPQAAGALGIGATVPVSFKFYLGRNGTPASCGESLPFTITATSDQAPPSDRSFGLSAERNTTGGPLTYGFETDLSGWTLTSGTFTRAAGGAPGSTGFSLQSRSLSNICDAILSPIIVPSASSTMTMWVDYGIQSGSFDRAVVRAVNVSTGAKTLLVPTSVPYTTTGSTFSLCDGIGALQGWSGSAAFWQQASFNLSAFAGVPIQIEVRYGTDSSTPGTAQGFWFDAVQITNAGQIGCDAQSDACAALPEEVSAPGSPTAFTITKVETDLDLLFSEAAGATSYHVYGGTLLSLGAGLYDHSASGGICSLVDAVSGDGQVTVSIPAVTVPDNSYLLAVGRNAAGESIYGTTSSGATIPLAVSSCP